MTPNSISDMLTRLRNASLAKKSFTIIKYTKANAAILRILTEEGYIQNFLIEDLTNGIIKKWPFKAKIKVFLKYKGWWIKKPAFSKIRQISKPGKRMYSAYFNFEFLVTELRDMQGIVIVSTSSGIMSHLKAKIYKKGGELVFYIG